MCVTITWINSLFTFMAIHEQGLNCQPFLLYGHVWSWRCSCIHWSHNFWGDMPQTGAAPSLLRPPEQEASFVFLQYKSDICLPSFWGLTSSSLSGPSMPPLVLGCERDISHLFLLGDSAQSHSIAMILTKEILFRIPSFITTPCGEWGVPAGS